MLLTVGNLVANKGHDLVLRALPDFPDACLLVIGEGGEERKLKDLARTLGIQERVRFLGAMPQEQLAAYYGAADALVLASSREGWPNVLLEAMACGTPVVSARVGGTPEIVAAPEAGVLMAERSAHGVVEALKAVDAELSGPQPDAPLCRAVRLARHHAGATRFVFTRDRCPRRVRLPGGARGMSGLRDIAITLIIFGSLPFIFKRAQIGVMMWVWVSVMNPHRLAYGFAHDFSFAAIIAGTTLLSVALSKDMKAPPLNAVTALWFLFVAWTGVSTIFAIHLDQSFIKWVDFMKTQLMAILIPMLFHKKEDLQRLIWVIVLSLAFYGTKGGLFTLLTGGVTSSGVPRVPLSRRTMRWRSR